jgi:hypothetical protein
MLSVSTNVMARLIREQMSSLQNDKKLPASNNKDLGKTNLSAASAQSILELVQTRVRSLSRDDPQRSKKAFRIFLESVLLDQLGANMINDPAFYQVVDTVIQTMESDIHLKNQMEQAGVSLCSSMST